MYLLELKSADLTWTGQVSILNQGVLLCLSALLAKHLHISRFSGNSPESQETHLHTTEEAFKLFLKAESGARPHDGVGDTSNEIPEILYGIYNRWQIRDCNTRNGCIGYVCILYIAQSWSKFQVPFDKILHSPSNLGRYVRIHARTTFKWNVFVTYLFWNLYKHNLGHRCTFAKACCTFWRAFCTPISARFASGARPAIQRSVLWGYPFAFLTRVCFCNIAI